MTRPIVLVACATMLAISPDIVRAATGPENGDRSTRCQAQDQRPEQDSKGGEWRERLGEWLRKHSQSDGISRRGYYLRSPLLHAFGPQQPEDCESEASVGRAAAPAAVRDARSAPAAEPVAPASKPCAEQVRSAAPESAEHARARADDHDVLAIAVHAALARGESVVFYDLNGNLLKPDGARTRSSAHGGCG